jgi:RNA polymerase sigma-70 factor (ECF subfamily)
VSRTRPTTDSSPPYSPPLLEPPSSEGASETMLSAEEADARASRELEERHREFTEIWNRHHRKLLIFARGALRATDEAEDVVQTVFTKAWIDDVIGKCGGDEKRIVTCLFTMTNHAVTDAYRKIGRQLALAAAKARSLLTRKSDYEAPYHNAEASDIQWQVDRALEYVSLACRKAYILVYNDDQSYEEAATILGIKESTLSAQLSKANRVVRERLHALGYCRGTNGRRKKEDRP